MIDDVDKLAHNVGRSTAPKVPTNWQEEYYNMKEALAKAVVLLKQSATCENCGNPLCEEPPRSVCGDASHVIAAREIAGLEKLLE